MPAKKKPGRGGKRPGAGRKPLREGATVRVEARLRPAEVAHLETLAGSAGAGLARLAEEALNQKP